MLTAAHLCWQAANNAKPYSAGNYSILLEIFRNISNQIVTTNSIGLCVKVHTRCISRKSANWICDVTYEFSSRKNLEVKILVVLTYICNQMMKCRYMLLNILLIQNIMNNRKGELGYVVLL